MPRMRWTQENEHLLWRTIFETQEIHIDLDKVAEAWPGDDKPTLKALSEQLYKYKKNSKDSKVTLSMGKRKTGDSAQSTPRKRAAPKKATPKKGGKENEIVKDETSPVKKETIKEENKDDYA